MDQPARQQIRLILDDQSDRLQVAVNERLKAHHVIPNFRRSGRKVAEQGPPINYGADETIRAAIKAMEDEGSKYITACVDRVKAIAMDIEAFAMIKESVEVSFRFFANKVDDLSAWTPFLRIDQSTRKAGRVLFAESRIRLMRQLEIHGFSFTVPYKQLTDTGISQPPVSKPKGGKPIAAHWDEMWAAIAVALYTGNLQPNTQADIERAMKDWLASKDIDAGDTSVRTRAQHLWKKLREAD